MEHGYRGSVLIRARTWLLTVSQSVVAPWKSYVFQDREVISDQNLERGSAR
jgi:hypothetical protein